MRTPTIHLNGSSREHLFEACAEALGALRRALRAMDDVSPNGRDYYPQGPEALSEALREHTSRCERIRSVLAELEQIAEAIQDAP